MRIAQAPDMYFAMSKVSKERSGSFRSGWTRKTIALPDEMWVEIDRYRHAEMIGTEVEALRRLVIVALTLRGSRAESAKAA